MAPEELGLKLTLHTVEVEGIQKQGDRFKNVVIGKILEIKKHPNADRLQLAKVDIGKEVLDIVCGAPNIAVGQYVPVATVGTILPNGLEIKEAEVRGEKSRGMLCAADELGLGDDHSGIMILKKAKLGSSFADYLGLQDIIFEVDNKALTNRPDLWGHFGMAREISAFLGAKRYDLELKEFAPGNDIKINLDIEDQCASRYMAVAIDNVKIEASPKWMQDRLVAVGVRPINNIVDITNYVMMELGQPMHAFDRDSIKATDQEINLVVRKSKDGEIIETIDGEKRKLDNNTIVIAKQEGAIAIAGIMGGSNSGVNSETRNIVIESANFNPELIRKASQKLSLRSESSVRFEKGLDVNLCADALKRAVELITKICPGAKVSSNVVDLPQIEANLNTMELDLHWLEKRIGQKIENREIVKILASLGFVAEKAGSSHSHILKVIVPTWRNRDIAIPEDLMEEVVRIYGYENLQPSMPKIEMRMPLQDDEKRLERKIRNILAGAPGLAEVYNYSFIGDEQLKKINMDPDDHISLANPLSSQFSMLRQNLLINIAGNIRANQARYEKLGLFELGNVYLSAPGNFYKDDKKQELLPYQEKHLAIALAGDNDLELFSEMKGITEYLFASLKIGISFKEVEIKPVWADAGICAHIISDNKQAGIIAKLDDQSAKRSGLKKNLVVAEIGFRNLLELERSAFKDMYLPIEKYPSATRDISFVVDKKILYNEIRDTIFGSSDLIKAVELFDIYEGEKIGRDNKSLAFHVTYQGERTFTSEEIDELQKKLIKMLEDKYEAKVRDF